QLRGLVEDPLFKLGIERTDFLLCLLALGDVHHRAFEISELTLDRADSMSARTNPRRRAVIPPQFTFEISHHPLPLEQRCPPLPCSGIDVKRVSVYRHQRFAIWIAQYAQEGGVGVQYFSSRGGPI